MNKYSALLRFVFIAASVLFVGIAANSHAQLSFGGSDIIGVTAQKAVYRGGKTVLSGNVKVQQKNTVITADKMVLFRAEKISEPEKLIRLGNIEQIIATGNFRYKTGNTVVSGKKGVYERNKNIITVTGNAVYKQGNNKVSGNKMIFDLKTNKARVIGNCSGRDCGKKDRVSISLGNDNRQ